MDKDYLQEALHTFNNDNWYGWKKNYTGEKRMTYANIKIIKDGATMPSEADVNAKIQELKNLDEEKINKKASGKQKLKDLGLTDEEIQALIGV